MQTTLMPEALKSQIQSPVPPELSGTLSDRGKKKKKNSAIFQEFQQCSRNRDLETGEHERLSKKTVLNMHCNFKI